MNEYMHTMLFLASGSNQNGGLVLLLLVAAVLLITIVVLIHKLTGGKEEETAREPATESRSGMERRLAVDIRDPEPETARDPVPEPETVTEPETEDEKYADAHNMWVCAYCETLNPRLPGDRKEPKPVIMPPVGREPAPSALRGDLLRKKALSTTTESFSGAQPECIACGRRRI